MFVKGPLNESLHNWRCEKGKEEFKELMFCSEGVTPLFSKYLLIACYVPGIVLGTGDTAVTRLSPCPHGVLTFY